MATTARNVSRTACFRAFKNGAIATFHSLESLESRRFGGGVDGYLDTLNLNSTCLFKTKHLQRFRSRAHGKGTHRALFCFVASMIHHMPRMRRLVFWRSNRAVVSGVQSSLC